MTRAEAQEILQAIKNYLTAGNPVWDVDEIAEACDMGIEALRNEINCVNCVHYTERETYTGIKGVCKMDTAHREDIISRQDAIDAIAKRIYHIEDGNENDALRKAICDIDALPSVNAIPYDSTVTLNSPTIIKATSTDLISRQDALKPFCIAPDGTRIPEVDCDNFPVEFSVEFIKKHLLSLPSVEPNLQQRKGTLSAERMR